MNNSWYEVAIEKAKKQSVIINAFAEQAPILMEMPMEPASSDMKNVFEKVKGFDVPQVVDLDTKLPVVNMDTELGETALFKIGGTLLLPEDKMMLMGGKENFMRKRIPYILREAGQKLDFSIYENKLKGAAIKAGRYKKIDTDGTGSSFYSMTAVKWVAGETTGLFNAQSMSDGKAFEQELLWGGNKGILPNGETGHQLNLKSYLGVQIGNEKYVYSLVNIDASNLPTGLDLLNLVSNVRGTPADTRIYINPTLLDMLINKFAAVNTNDYSNVIRVSPDGMTMTVKGIPFVQDYNILDGKETAIA